VGVGLGAGVAAAVGDGTGAVGAGVADEKGVAVAAGAGVAVGAVEIPPGPFPCVFCWLPECPGEELVAATGSLRSGTPSGVACQAEMPVTTPVTAAIDTAVVTMEARESMWEILVRTTKCALSYFCLRLLTACHGPVVLS
jgi:hypothetical protein